MIVLHVQNLVKEYNGEKVFEPVTFTVNSDDRICLLGSNGCGKSTLLKMIIKEVEPSQGVISVGSNIKIGYLSQKVIKSEENTIYVEALDAVSELIELEKELEILSNKISTEYDEKMIEKYSNKEHLFSSKGGYEYRYKVDTVLNMFGFDKSLYDRKVGILSGGEQTRLAFAKLLLIQPDLLLLDEPTNHLDVLTIEWLETFLKSYQGALFVVSHDRTFISSIANRIFEFENNNLEIYNGDYQYFTKEKIVRYEQRLKEYNKQQKEIAKIKWFIEFYMPKPRFVSRAHDREKKLARIESNLLTKPKEEKNRVHIDFKGNVRKGKTLINFEDVSIGYQDDKVELIKDINFTLYGQDHLVVMGSNGSGKTTFVKTLMNRLKPLNGNITFKTDLNIGYLQQDFVNVSSDKTIFNYFLDLFPTLTDQNIYDHLGKFNFSYTDANEKIINSLSGGEQMRVVIAKLALENYDLLILDEPTNHLDLFSKSELIDALNDYEGTLIVVSHDRDFIDKIANKIIYFHNSKFYFYEGSYNEFKSEKLSQILKEEEERLKAEKEEKSKTSSKNKENNLSSSSKPNDKPKISIYSYEKILTKIEKLEEKLKVLNSYAFLEEYYSFPEKMKELQDQITSIETEIAELYQKLNDMESKA